MFANINKFMRRLKAVCYLLPAVFILGFCGCYIDASDTDDDEPPAVPRGVFTTTGDEQISVAWYPNAESDLGGYRVWRGYDGTNFDELLTETAASRYVDTDVRNGETYFMPCPPTIFTGTKANSAPKTHAIPRGPKDETSSSMTGRSCRAEVGSISHGPTKEAFPGIHPKPISISAWSPKSTSRISIPITRR